MTANDVPLTDRNIRVVLERALRERPNQIAVKDAHVSISYAELWKQALRLASGFSELGLQRQARALIMLDNNADSILGWIALALTARVEVPVNTAYKGAMLAHIVADSGAQVIVAEAHYLGALTKAAADAPNLKTIVIRGDALPEDLAAARKLWRICDLAEFKTYPQSSPDHLDPWDLMSVSYTSGTTGRSKGVLCPQAHAYMHASGRGLSDTRPGETRIVVLPQFHIAGRWGGVYNAFICGATAYVPESFSATTFWRQAAEVGATTSELVGTMAEFLWRQPPSPDDRAHKMREIMILPAPADTAMWKDRFGINVSSGYGSTEIGSVVERYEPEHRGVGRPRAGFTIRIVDENDIEVPPHVVGELVVRPETPWTSSMGYLNNAQQSMETWRNGWLHSGDALYRDDDGNFFFVDRVDDAIRRRGENISSAEVEHFLLSHPDVAEAAAVAVPSEFAEDEIKAVIVVKEGAALSEAELVKFMADAVPYFMVPRYVEIVAALPKTPTAKVKKKELRATGVANAWDASAHGALPRRDRRPKT